MSLGKVAIIILNYKNYKDTIECINSILKQGYQDYDIIIVDNCSNNDSVSEITNYCTKNNLGISVLNGDLNTESCFDGFRIITLIVSSQNNGYAYGNNLGLKYAVKMKCYKYYWVLNNDTTVKEDTLTKMTNVIDEDTYKRPVGNFIYYYNSDMLQTAGGIHINRLFFRPDFTRHIDKIDYLSGASFLIDNVFLNKYGLIYEDYFLDSEDLDYFYKYKKEFVRINKGVTPFSVAGEIFHKDSASIGKFSPLAAYYLTRNLFYSCRKYSKYHMPILYLYTLIRFLKWLIKNKEASKSVILGIRDYRRGVLGKVDYF